MIIIMARQKIKQKMKYHSTNNENARGDTIHQKKKKKEKKMLA